jgi:hypothetical protein
MNRNRKSLEIFTGQIRLLLTLLGQVGKNLSDLLALLRQIMIADCVLDHNGTCSNPVKKS